MKRDREDKTVTFLTRVMQKQLMILKNHSFDPTEIHLIREEGTTKTNP